MSDVIKSCIALCVFLGFMAVSYFVGRSDGHKQGLSECHTASLQSQLMAANEDRANLKAQLANRDAAAKQSDAEKQAIAADLARLQGQVQAVPFHAGCVFPREALRLLNEARGQ